MLLWIGRVKAAKRRCELARRDCRISLEELERKRRDVWEKVIAPSGVMYTRVKNVKLSDIERVCFNQGEIIESCEQLEREASQYNLIRKRANIMFNALVRLEACYWSSISQMEESSKMNGDSIMEVTRALLELEVISEEGEIVSESVIDALNFKLNKAGTF